MARYGYGDAAVAAADVAWRVGRIMLKYRSIAPKPITGGAVAGSPLETNKSSSGRGKRRGSLKEGKRGRKSAKKAFVDVGAFREGKNNNEFSTSSPVVTLPLMPMTPERKDEPPSTPSPTSSHGHVAVSYFGRPTWQRRQQQVGTTAANNISGPAVVVPRPVRPVGSWVTVECVTDTWRYGQVDSPLAGPTVIESDTCPVLVSDAYDRVTWTNAAYKRMVVGPSSDEDEEEVEVRVSLMTRGLVPERVTCFTCRVRVRYACRSRGKVSMAVPCDAWRLDDERIAWRLDVKAALSLSYLGC